MVARYITIAALGAVTAVVEPVAAQTTAVRKPADAQKPGQTFKECRNCPEMVVVPDAENGPSTECSDSHTPPARNAASGTEPDLVWVPSGGATP